MSDLYHMYILDIYVLFLYISIRAECSLYEELYKIPEILEESYNNV